MSDRKRLTKSVVDALKPDPAGRDIIYFDPELRGFGVRVKASGAKSYILKYRNRFGQQRKLHIARVGDVTPDQARTKALKLRGRIAEGEDPAADKSAERKAITVAQLCDEYLEASHGHIKGSTLKMDRSRIARHVKPLLGSKPVASLTPADLEKFVRDVMTGKTATKPPKGKSGGKRARGGLATGGPGVASRTLGMLGTILERAVRDGILDKNPARGISRPKDRVRKPPFSFEAVAILGTAMREAEADGENQTALRAIRFLLLTGCRRMEALTLNWATVDRNARCLRFADTKSGAQIRPIGSAALRLITDFEPDGAKPADFVFLGSSKAGHFVGLPHAWERLCKRAGIEGVSLHGLRHWFASAATELGYSELVIAGLLGHRVKGVTARYATAPDSALLAAADRVSRKIAAALDGLNPGDVVPIRRAI
ncbi:MAG: integrase arm-type DNA-binding domain-containing protein [Alphaproteobacteria bacterium]|nr:integrase arm-type DNA-binding domain-containing protein [Alphaproteobacteria bacterium]